ncbi:MAG: hypothetical protein ACYC99_02765 [Candidatus Geothermincolia bacterium]
MWRMKRWFWWTLVPLLILGIIFLILGARANPTARTTDGYSLKWFWYIMGFWFLGLTLAVYAGIFFWLGRGSRKVERMRTTGLKGFATVLSAGATGTELNNMPRVEMELEVQLEGIPAYKVTHMEFVNPVNLASFQSGSILPVLVDPKNHRKLIIDWDSA